MTNEKNKPVHHVRVGNIVGTIWVQQGDHGDYYTTSFQRSVKKNDKWENFTSFFVTDLPLISEVSHRLLDWILAQKNE